MSTRGVRYHCDQFNGNGKITCVLDRKHLNVDPAPNQAVPVSKLVILFSTPDLYRIRSGWSDDDGLIEFDYLNMNFTYMVYSPGFVGPTGQRFNAECCDQDMLGNPLMAELMT